MAWKAAQAQLTPQCQVRKERQRPMRMLYLAKEQEFIDVWFKNVQSPTKNLTSQVIPQGQTSV